MKPEAKGVHLKVDLNIVITLLLVLFLAVSGTISASATPSNRNPAQTDSPDPNAASDGPEDLEGEPQAEQPSPDWLTPNGEEDPLILSGSQLEGSVVLNSGGGMGTKSFYITEFNVYGADPLTACSAGYHMASLWELHDVTRLNYASSHPDAKVRADNGSGPTAGWWGWARTGNDSSIDNIAGKANCGNWTSSTGGQYGTIVRLPESWMEPAVVVSPWEAIAWSCQSIAPVWCIGD